MVIRTSDLQVEDLHVEGSLFRIKNVSKTLVVARPTTVHDHPSITCL